MSFTILPTWATEKHYFHHSNPESVPVCKKFYDKCVIRPLVNRCWQILKDEIVGDKDYARQLIEIYKDDNANMMSGRVVQDIANKHLVDDMTFDEALRHGMAAVDEYEPRKWDHGKDADKLAINRDELADVAQHAVEGVMAAHRELGLNRITGESEVLTRLPGLELPYSGFPDFSGQVELKTKWSKINIKAKNGKSAASLPTKPDWSHVCQVAGYWSATGKPQLIVYANAKGHRVFSAENCDRLPTEGMQAALNQITAKCKVRENLLKKADSVEELLTLVEPDFGHFFAWDVRPEVLKQAKTAWGFR